MVLSVSKPPNKKALVFTATINIIAVACFPFDFEQVLVQL